jgi:protein transport protein SEC61 subunit gamma-like protein
MEKLKPYARIIRVAKKPNMQEFRVLLKVTGLGVILIGIIGFAIRMGRTLLF